ncbi:hypothetical protein BUALT_Bualt15G0105200 [Buddleja alternifolia]|uniref:Uncharacterized protein n=1 Tax=Buddleja alternifolia TaxID=168488 RepID=A0AAV6WJF0_9LAMI|nr:hypothetical protein BUALT_Bualt15G0105200 [Buddleja alternifolia]
MHPILSTTASDRSKTFGGIETGNQSRGSRTASYSATPEEDGRQYISISAMPIYQDKSHEELRSEDYELRVKGSTFSFQNQGGAQQSNFQFGSSIPPAPSSEFSFGSIPVSGSSAKSPFGSNDTLFGLSPSFTSGGSICNSNNVDQAPKNTIFGLSNNFPCPPLSIHSFLNSPFNPFKSNPSPPISQVYTTTNKTSVNPFSPESQAFTTHATGVSTMPPTFTPNMIPSSSTPLRVPMPAVSSTFASPSVSALSSSRPSSTVVPPSIQSISVTACGTWPFIPNASQIAEKVDSLSTSNISQPSQAPSSLKMVIEVGNQNINGQQQVFSTTVSLQPSNSIAMQSVADTSSGQANNAVTSTQCGTTSTSGKVALVIILHSKRKTWLLQ